MAIQISAEIKIANPLFVNEELYFPEKFITQLTINKVFGKEVLGFSSNFQRKNYELVLRTKKENDSNKFLAPTVFLTIIV